MKKRILSLALAVLMVLSATVFASAAAPVNVALEADLTIAATSGSVYASTAESWATTPDAATFKLQCKIDMKPVRDELEAQKKLAIATGVERALEKFNEFKTEGTFTITVEYDPALLTIPAVYTTGTGMDGFSETTKQYYTVESRTNAAGKLTVVIKTARPLTVAELESGALDDIVMTVSGVGVTAFDTPATIKASMTGNSHSQRTNEDGTLGSTSLDVNYTTAAATVTATAKKTVPGTGPAAEKTKYTLTFDVEGNTSLVSAIRKTEGTVLKTADFRVPYRDGCTFKGWFLDKAMTEKVGETITLTGDMTVYGGFKKTEPLPEISEKLETIDHFAYVEGYPDGTVRPEANITREETAMMLYRLLKEAYRKTVESKTHNFHDGVADRWSNDAIATLTKAGILAGYPDGSFNPGAQITRAEFATIVARIVGVDEKATHGFTDLNGHWAEKYIATAVSYGWIAGYEDGTFRPEGKITRAEAMTMVNRILYRYVNEAGQHKDTIKWPDNLTEKWYYFAVQEATNGHDYNRQDNGVYENWTDLRK